MLPSLQRVFTPAFAKPERQINVRYYCLITCLPHSMPLECGIGVLTSEPTLKLYVAQLNNKRRCNLVLLSRTDSALTIDC